jgi:DNA or RNA helicases of superfamily II
LQAVWSFVNQIAGRQESTQRHLDSTMDAETRKERLKWLKITPNAVLCNVGILTTGFDEPTIEVVILYRATTSLPLFLQMVAADPA